VGVHSVPESLRVANQRSPAGAMGHLLISSQLESSRGGHWISGAHVVTARFNNPGDRKKPLSTIYGSLYSGHHPT